MYCAIAALTAAIWAGELPAARAAAPAQALTVRNCLVTLIDEVDVPAQEMGLLTQVAVVEGQQMTEGDLLAQIDDQKSRVLYDVAKYKLDVAREEAGNDINKRYAVAAAKVAKAELESAYAANAQAAKTVPQTELNRLHLQHEQFVLQIEQAVRDLAISKVTVSVRESELDAAQQDVARLQILAPFDGVVENVHRRKGEWVQPGEPVVKLLRIDRLWIEGMVDAGRYTPSDVRARAVVVTVALPGRYEQFQGKVVFASDKVEAGNQFRVKAEVVNRQDPRTGAWVLRSGLNADMAIDMQ